LAARQAAPWSRKMSATSRAGRAMTATDYIARSTFLPLLAPLGGLDSRWSGLSMLAIMPVATRV
jgi:hypothetical protein